jgi:hypothetical protein
MKRLWVVIPLGTLLGVAVILACLYGFYRLQDVLYPDSQEPSTASQHHAVSLAVGGLKHRNEHEFLSAANLGDPAIGRRAWKSCSEALDLNPTFEVDGITDPSAVGIVVTVPGDELKGCSFGLEWTGPDWLHHRGWAYAAPTRGSS